MTRELGNKYYAVIAVYKEHSELSCFLLTMLVNCSFKVMAAIDFFSADLEDFKILGKGLRNTKEWD